MTITLPGGAGLMGQGIARYLLSDRAIIDVDEVGIDAGTSTNMSIAAQIILAQPRRHGVFAPEEYFDPATYFPELEKRHFTVRTEVRLR